MRKIVVMLIVMVLLIAIVPQTIMAASNCNHKWEKLEGSSNWIPMGSSGHKLQTKMYNWCSKCGATTDAGWKTSTTTYNHLYHNVGSKQLKSASRINGAQHVAYYTQKQECYACHFERTLNSSQTESHSFVNRKCTKCGAKDESPKVWDNE